MTWTAKNSSILSLRPRKLIADEIDDILSVVPSVRGCSRLAEKTANDGIKARLRFDLTKLEITPDGFPDLKREIGRLFERSRIEPQTPVGMIATESLGRPITQTTLNTFHQAGSSRNVTGGLQAIKEMVDASQRLKTEVVTVMLRNLHLDYMEVFRKRRSFIGLTVGSIVQDHTIYSIEELPREWWHTVGPKITNKRIPECKYILRLKLDINRVYQHRATLGRIVAAIEDVSPAKIVVLHGSLHEGIIDLFPDRNSIVQTMSEMKKGGYKLEGFDDPDYIFLENVVLPFLDKILIQGIKHVKEFYPVPKPVWNIVLKEERVTDREWWLYINTRYVRQTSIEIGELERLLQALDIDVMQRPGRNEEQKYLVATKDVVESIGDMITKNIEQAREKDKLAFEDQRKNKEIVNSPLSHPLLQVSDIYTINLIASSDYDFRHILAHPEVNPNFTYCNNIHKMEQAIGILASRNLFMHQFSAIASAAGAMINPRHIDVFIAMVYSQGKLNGITFSGINSGDSSFMTLATFRQTMSVFAKAAMTGEHDPVSDTSSSIIHGVRINLGTGAFDVDVKPEERARMEEAMNKVPELTVDQIEKMTDAFTEEELNHGVQTVDQLELPVDMPRREEVQAKRAAVLPEKLRSGFESFSTAYKFINMVIGATKISMRNKVLPLYWGLGPKPIYIPAPVTTYALPGVNLPIVTLTESFLMPVRSQVKVELIILPDDFDSTYDSY